ncbi:MAG TPA: NAD(P)/FAD-dependent oxidoreductase [Methanotrichaceae archaeon]|nr:NAD(P)/FAD-dependent oxidoreductase [Methanotrichaceae archaeon]
MKCDVLVVGASPAGIMAAISAAEMGSSVVLLDKDMESFCHPANTLFEGMASRAGLKVEDCYIRRSLDGMRIISPRGNTVTISGKGYFLDREKFDNFYLDMAEDRGAIILKGEARDTRLHNGRRSVIIGDESIDAGVVIDASGIGSTIASRAGLSPMRHPEDIAWAMEAVVKHPSLGDEDLFEYWIGSISPGWKATFSPGGGDTATLGVFVRGHGQNVQPFFRDFLKRFKRHKSAAYPGIEDMKILSVRRGGDPIATLPGEIVSDGLMIAGGAAGQSGLAYSMRAGAICGKVASEAVAAGDTSQTYLSRYQRLWRSEFYMEYLTARACLETLGNMSDRDLDQLTKGLGGKNLLAGGSFYKKLICAGAMTALAKPGAIPALMRNMLSG